MEASRKQNDCEIHKANFFETRRIQLGMTQRQIAESFTPPITPAAVSNWENDVVGPSFDAEEIARVYKCKLIDALTAINETRRSRRAENTAKATAAP